MTRWGGVMRPNPTNYSMNLPRWTRIWAGDYNSEWVQRWSRCALRVYTTMHMATVSHADTVGMTPICTQHRSKYVCNFKPVDKTQKANGKHKRIIQHFLPAENIQTQRGGSSWTPRQPVFPSEDRAQRISGSQWARPERLSARRSEGGPLLPVTSSDCCLQLTTQCWKLCCKNSHIPVQIGVF